VSKESKHLKKYFDILEVNPNSTFFEVKSAYFHLKKLYSSKSVVLSPIEEDITETNRRKIIENLKEAYEVLREYYSTGEKEKIQNSKERVNNRNVPEFEVFSGNALKLTREVLGVELEELSLFTGISIQHLKNIELENFNLLPPKGYIRLFLKKYADVLSLDSEKVIKDYLKIVDLKLKK
jgi:hypothetical protein